MQAALFLLGRFDVDEGKLLHRSATAAVAAATDHAGTQAGSKPTRRVALKAMRDAGNVLNELKDALASTRNTRRSSAPRRSTRRRNTLSR